MAAVHGGRPTDFTVAQATITPYLIICQNSRIRNAIVQRGIYIIPNTQIQFTVHEWRPRFGMGHDPPTRQVWIKIVGLPLQAWTMSGIMAVIQKFGHPMQILPFGQEAGHSRDITALVATNDLSQIPLAFSYREGDYSTRVDILLLRWRLWEDTFFPPPDNPYPYGNLQPHQQLRDNPTTPNRRSSSSSSNDAHSEPTLDLSAWSPRSRQLVLYSPRKHNVDLVLGKGRFQANEERKTNLSPQRQVHWLSSLASGRFSLRLLLHGRELFLAVENQRQSSDIHTFSLGTPQVGLDLLSVPNPIHLNAFPFPLTQTAHACTLEPDLGIATGAKERRYSPLSLAHPLRERAPLNIPDISRRKSPEKGIMHTKENGSPMERPLANQPKKPTKHAAISNTSHSKKQMKPTKHQGQPVQPRSQLESATLPSLQRDLARLQPAIPLYHLPTAQNLRQTNAPTQFIGADLQFDKPKDHSFLLTKDSLLPIELPVSPPQALSQAPPQQTEQHSRPKMRARKGELQATRRSDRLRQRQSGSLPQLQGKGNNSTKKIDFSLQSNSHDTPLEVSSVLNILQATGVQITEQIEEMIDEALKQDMQAEPSDLLRPTTPLHDIIPPLALPGEDLLL